MTIYLPMVSLTTLTNTGTASIGRTLDPTRRTRAASSSYLALKLQITSPPRLYLLRRSAEFCCLVKHRSHPLAATTLIHSGSLPPRDSSKRAAQRKCLTSLKLGQVMPVDPVGRSGSLHLPK